MEDRITPSRVNIGHGTPVPPSKNFAGYFNVAGYNLHQDNASYATTSSAFGFSAAEMTHAQKVTTRHGGATNAQLTNAFNGALSFGLARGVAIPPPPTSMRTASWTSPATPSPEIPTR